MINLSAVSAGTCLADYRKYSDTVAVCSGIFHLFQTNPKFGYFVGIEHKLIVEPNEFLTPDITTIYEKKSKGLLFEFKYSLPINFHWVKGELHKLARYNCVKNGWGVKEHVQLADFILVCHIDDVKRVVEAAKQIFSETQNPFFNPMRFSIWSWTISTERKDPTKEEMRLQNMYGAIRNVYLQNKINEPGGILIDERVLMALRFSCMFIRQKPPVQYTIILLTQNVFSALQHPLSIDIREYEVDLDLIYKKANELFPPWWENDVKTIQLKRSWIKEALDTLVMIKLINNIPEKKDSYSIPIPTLPIRKQADITICKKIEAAQKKAIRHRGLHYIPKSPKKKPSGTRSLKDYLLMPFDILWFLPFV